MVIEHVEIRILPGRQAEFEEAITRALRTVTARAQGMHGYVLRRSIEFADRYVMEVQWETVEHHTVIYKGGPLTHEFRAIVSHLFAEPPVVQHLDLVVEGK